MVVLEILPLCASSLWASVLVHEGANNPITEGWSIEAPRPEVVLTVSVYNDQGSGVDAWRVEDASDEQFAWISYGIQLSETSAAQAFDSGWSYRISLRVLGDTADVGSPTVETPLGFLYASGSKKWHVRIQKSPDDDLIVGAFERSDLVFRLPGAGGEYHTYLIICGPETTTATLFLDGNQVFSWDGFDLESQVANPQVVWGFPSAWGTGNAHFSAVRFAISAESRTNLAIQTYAGLTVTGEVGKVYSVEYVAHLSQTNNPSAWRCLEFLQLPASPYLWADKSAPATGKRFYRAVAMEAPTNMVFIPPGTFRMGSPTNEVDREDSEGPQTDVIISRGFWMGKYEVTQGQYLEMTGNNPSYFNGVRGGVDWEFGYGTDLTRPVEQVYWSDAANYCAKLTEHERVAGRIPTNCVYRLPTEAEWEYACRAGTSTRFSYGDDPGYTSLTDHAWYLDNWNNQTHPVGQKLPNPWGLYDMHGNVVEWCQDWLNHNLPGGIALDPQGPPGSEYRVVRGGGWGSMRDWRDPQYCRSAFRGGGYAGFPDVPLYLCGFRAVLAPGQP